MKHYVAFLRAINVGGHTVTKDRLLAVFSSLGLTDGETFLASGNVLFATQVSTASKLEGKIASALESALGYEVATFLRTQDEVFDAMACRPFPPKELSRGVAYNIGFLAKALTAEQSKKLAALRTENDSLVAVGREIHWLCQTRQSESSFNGGKLERNLGLKVTFRSESSLNKLLSRWRARSSG